MRVDSDFEQSYDAYLPGDDVVPGVLQRYSRMGMDKRSQLVLLSQLGLRVPRYGTFQQMKRLDIRLVVHVDPEAHRGEGKVLWEPGTSWEPPWNTLAVEYIDHSYTQRRLYTGKYTTSVNYVNNDDEWRSNVNPVDVWSNRPWLHDGSCFSVVRWPLFAIDFVDGRAIDFNVSPGVPDDIMLSPQELGASIGSVFKQLGDEGDRWTFERTNK